MRSPAAAGTGSGGDFPTLYPPQLPLRPDPCDNLFPSPGRHYYLAVDRTEFKIRTLLELLGVVTDRRGGLPIAICVSSRDELDAVCAAVANLPFVSMSPLTTKGTDIAESSKPESKGTKLTIVVATDACLPQAAMAEAPLLARVLMNYELRASHKEGSLLKTHVNMLGSRFQIYYDNLNCKL
nr:unnamed protein product [Digitaria exilis]